MSNERTYTLTPAATALVALFFLRTFSPAPLPMHKTLCGAGAYRYSTKGDGCLFFGGYRGGSLFERRDFAIAESLVKHPKGDLLIDTGFGRDIDQQFRPLATHRFVHNDWTVCWLTRWVDARISSIAGAPSGGAMQPLHLSR